MVLGNGGLHSSVGEFSARHTLQILLYSGGAAVMNGKTACCEGHGGGSASIGKEGGMLECSRFSKKQKTLSSVLNYTNNNGTVKYVRVQISGFWNDPRVT